MSASDEYSALIFGQLMELKKTCGNLFHRQIRDSITEGENYFKELPNTKNEIDLRTALQPFFAAMKDEKKRFQTLVLDTFYKVFQQANEEKFPDNDLTQEIFTILVDTELQANDDLNLKICNMAISCLKSPSGIRFVHGNLLERMFNLLFKIYNNTENQSALNTIETAIKPIITALFTNYDVPVEIPADKTTEEIAASIVSMCAERSIDIITFMEPILKNGDYTATIRDVDLYVMFTVLAHIIEKNEMHLKTIILVTNYMIFALKQKSNFFKTTYFKHLLNTTLHVSFLALAMNSTIELAELTGELIFLLWDLFAPLYNIGLNEILTKALLTTLISPDPKVLDRSLAVYEHLAKQPRFFVDCFINYDCDESGFFQNVFENTFSQIVKMSYPSTPQTPVQAKSLKVVVSILGAMWEYFSNFQVHESAENEPEGPQSFLEAKKAKDVFTEGLSVFKRSFKKGLAFFIQHGTIEDDPKSIAKFLFNTPSLDPAMVGEAIGSSGERCINTLKEFTDLFDFKGLTFEQAFRQYLSKFQIPGEAQMIDRVMEQFGTKFYKDNPTLFSSADTVYVLAFSTLMLHTDAWHPNVKSRMTLDQFIQNNKGIDGGRDLPYQLLEDLYKGITTTRIFLPNSAMPNSALLTRAQRSDLYKSQCTATITQAKQRNETEAKKWHKSESPLFIGPMFDVVWRGALAVLTMTFEISQNEEIYTLCLNGLSLMVHIASHCFVESALDTLVDSFAKFTNLRKGISDLKLKNIECTNALLRIAMDDRHFLRGAWDIVMGEVSALDKLKESGELNFNIEEDIIDELFTQSPTLDRESLVDFVRAICSTSKLELNEEEPRMFSLQKMCVVAHYNVKRPRFIWMAVWEIMGAHLEYVGSSTTPSIAEVAIDLTRQLASKFLQEEELSSFHFQQHFLAPFQKIYDRQRVKSVRELVLTCLSVIVSESAAQLQSGWIVVFQVLTSSAASSDTCNLGFSVVEQLINTQLTVLEPQFLHIISVICSFVAGADDDTIRAKAAEFFGPISRHTPKDENEKWEALLQAMSRYGNDPSKEVRRATRGSFLETLSQMTEASEEVWEDAILNTAPEFFSFNKNAVSDDDELGQFVHDIKSMSLSKKYLMIHLLLKLILSTDSVSSVSIASLMSIELPLDEKSFKAFTDGLKHIENKFINVQLENQIAFLALCEYLFLGDSQLNELIYDFINKVIAEIESETKEDGSKTYNPLTPYIRTTLLKSTKSLKGDEQCREVIKETLEMYKEATANIQQAAENQNLIKSWNLSVKATLEILRNSSDFEESFKASSDLIVDLILSESPVVRKSVSATLTKKFIKE